MHYGDMRSCDEGATRMDELDYELWHACAGPLTSLPPVESLVMYWPQGHIEQVVACTPDSASAADILEASKHFKLDPYLLCKISKIELQADPQTDDVFAQMDLIPQDEGQVTKEMKDAPPPSKQNNVRSFCKTLTASDTSTHGGFSVPRRAAEDCLPLLDYNMNPPCQELVAKDLHGKEWNFRHIYRGHPRRHLLTTGWSVFVSQKRLVAGDTVIFLRGENGQLRVGVRRASKQLPIARSTYFSSANLHLGVLAAASHAAVNMIRFSVIYNPRTSPSEFVIPYHKYLKAEENNFTVGSRFKMKFESDESTERRYSGTIIEVGDVDPFKWRKSAWRSMKVEWDESVASERHERVSPWEIEPFVPISSLPPPPVGPRHKRRPPTPVTDLSPLGTSQSVLDSFQSNKLARILQVHDPWNESKLGDVTAPSPLQGSGRTTLPTTLLNNDPHLPTTSLVQVNNPHLPTIKQCKLFGFNLTDKAVPAPVSSTPSQCDDSEASGPWPTTDTDYSSPIFVDQHFSKIASGAYQTATAPVRSGTKVFPGPGKLGRTIDLKKCESYAGLRRMLTSLFGLEGEFDDPSKGWQLIYTDHENDILLVGDDPWEEFCSCVRSLTILSPTDVPHHLGKHPT